jgi:hypothetical protein
MLVSPHFERRRILNSVRKLFRSRLTLLLALLAAFARTLAGPGQRAASATCVPAASVNYYSDATYTTVVGNCVHACCRTWTCTGQLTQYSVVVWEVTCDFN